MNGARSTYMRKGYLLTALAAAVLLAASSGTAQAQDGTVRIDSITLSPSTVPEGEEATATVKFTLMAAADNTAVIAADELTVGFAFVIAATADTATATNATAADFTGLGADVAALSNQEGVNALALGPGLTRTYTSTRTFRVNHDLDAEADRFKIAAQVTGWQGSNAAVDETSDDIFKITDDETQTYALTLDPNAKDKIVELGAPVTVTLTADPKRTSMLTVPTFTLVLDPTRGFPFVRTGGVTEAEWQTAIKGALGDATGTEGSRVTYDIGTIAASEDKNRVDDSVTLTLYTGGVGTSDFVTDLAVPAEDINKLAASDHITAVAKDKSLNGEKVEQIVEGGDPVYLTITVDRGTTGTKDLTTGEALSVDLRASAGQVGDIVVEPSRISLPSKASGKSSSEVEIMLTARPDEDVGDEVLMLELVVSGVDPERGSGTSTGVFPITIVDATTKKVTPKTTEADYQKIKDAMEAGAGEDGLNPGESFMVMTSDLFDVMAGYDPTYRTSVVGEGVSVGISAAGDTVTVDAKSATSGEGAKVTITAKVDPVGSSLLANQTVSDEASVTFPVMVVDTPLSVMVTADPMEIDEGGTSMIIATASRAVEAGDGAVEINLVVVGDATLAADSIMIAAGDMSGYTMLTATADDDMDDETVVVVASGSGITTSMQVEVAVTDTTEPVEPVPALPLIAQWLLGLGLMGGGARLYRRRQG